MQNYLLVQIKNQFLYEKSNIPEAFQKQLFANVLQNRYSSKFCIFRGKHLCWSICLIKLLPFWPATLLETDFSTGIFLWLFQNNETPTQVFSCKYCKSFQTSFFHKVNAWLIKSSMVENWWGSSTKLRTKLKQMVIVNIWTVKTISKSRILMESKKQKINFKIFFMNPKIAYYQK